MNSLLRPRLSNDLPSRDGLLTRTAAIQRVEQTTQPPRRTLKGLPFYTMEEVATHNSAESCWLVVRGKVYDVTSFLPKHPGTPNAVLRHAGTDSTVDYDFHSAQTQALWEDFHVGYLEGYQKKSCTIS